MRKITQTAREVEEILRENAASRMTGVPPRDSDKELYIQYLQRILGVNLSAEQMKLIRSVNYESLCRYRRKFQEGGQYLPSPTVARNRRLKSYEIQQTAPIETAGGLQRRIETND